MEAESSLLLLQVERDKINGEKEQLETEHKQMAEEKTGADEQVVRLQDECRELQEKNDDLEGPLQVMTEERDAARAKEDENFEKLQGKEEELVCTSDGYIYLTERLQEKETELDECREQTEKMK